MTRTSGVGCLMAVVASLSDASPAAADQLADALAAHKAAVGMVDTIHLMFESNRERLVSFGPPPERIVGEYWRTRDAQRLNYSQTGLTQSIFILPDRVAVVGQSVNPKTRQPLLTASITPNAGPIFVSVAPWRDALYALDSNRGMGTQWLGDHVREFFGKAKYTTEHGLGVITSGNGAVTVRLDPKHNYLICGKTSRLEGVKNPMKPAQPPGTQRIDEEVREFQEVAPGVYFPKQVVIEERLGEELQSRRTVTFSAVRVNTPIAASVFEPKYKDGTEVTDFVRSTKYKVNEAGHPKEPEVPLTKLAVGPHSEEREAEPGLPTAKEPRRWGWWLAPAGLGLVLIGLSVIVWRRSRG
jgi:hypothetical protein